MKTALVTSSTKGVGKEIALQLLNEGYYVIVNYCSDDEGARLLVESLPHKFHSKIMIIKCDLSSLEGIQMFCTAVKKYTNRLDCIVLNTGITCYSDFPDITLQEWEKVLNTNLTMPFFILEELNRLLCNDGRIIFISSRMGDTPHGRSIPYAVSKAGVNMLAKSLVKIYAHRNITVNTISIGFVDTDWHKTKTKEHIERIENKIALKRLGTTKEVALLCKHIIENGYINGATLNIDGGYDMC